MLFGEQLEVAVETGDALEQPLVDDVGRPVDARVQQPARRPPQESPERPSRELEDRQPPRRPNYQPTRVSGMAETCYCGCDREVTGEDLALSETGQNIREILDVLREPVTSRSVRRFPRRRRRSPA